MSPQRRSFLKGTAFFGSALAWLGFRPTTIVADTIERVDRDEFRDIQQQVVKDLQSRTLPDGEWHVVVTRASFQHNVMRVFIDRMIPAGKDEPMLESANFAVCLRSLSILNSGISTATMSKAVTHALNNMDSVDIWDTDGDDCGAIVMRHGELDFHTPVEIN